MDVEFLGADEVMAIRERLATTVLAQRAFGGIAPLYPDRLDTAVNRQHTGYGRQRKYTRLTDIAATLFYGLNMGHIFENGNKRTALVSLLVFLQRNDLVLVDTSEDDLYDLATQTADHALGVKRDADTEVAYIADWIVRRTRPTDSQWRQMRFREFRKSLEELGCEFDPPDGNAIKIRRTVIGRGLSVKTGYPNEHFIVPRGETGRIRRALELDEQHGYDSGAIYDLAGAVDAFVQRYQHLMDRLADM